MVDGDRPVIPASHLIIGVDPGGTTGLAWVLNGQFESVDLPPLEAMDKVDELVRRRVPTVIAAERYNITAQTIKKTRQYDALEVIGACRWLAYRYHASFLLQSAGEAQRAGNREVLRVLGWWKPGGDHLNKAAAQVALAFQRALPQEFTKLIEPGMLA